MSAPPKVEVKRDEGYRTIIVSGIYGGLRPGFFEAIIYTDEMVADEVLSTFKLEPEKAHIKRTLQCRLVIDPTQAKSIMRWLTQHIENYEKTFGKIVLPEEVKFPEKPPPGVTV